MNNDALYIKLVASIKFRIKLFLSILLIALVLIEKINNYKKQVANSKLIANQNIKKTYIYILSDILFINIIKKSEKIILLFTLNYKIKF